MGVLCVLTVTNLLSPKQLSHIPDELHVFAIILNDLKVNTAESAVCRAPT